MSTPRFKQMAIRLAMVATVTASSLALLAGPVAASAAAFTQRSTVDPTGAALGCAAGDLTVTGGVFDQVFHLTLDAQGLLHVTGTGVPHDVTLEDAAHNSYTLTGATWFGGTFADPAGNIPILVTSTDFFIIRDASGRAVDAVRVLEHLSPNGQVTVLDFGSCQPPAN